jgi:transposase InsO family protein
VAGDLTYIRTWSGWVYVAFVLDAYSRRIVGRQAATHMRTDLPLDALEMALWRDFDEVERAVFPWVAWYTGERLHSALGYLLPDENEPAYWAQLEQVPQTA